MLVPKFVTTLRDYSRPRFVTDPGAGVIVDIVALPPRSRGSSLRASEPQRGPGSRSPRPREIRNAQPTVAISRGGLWDPANDRNLGDTIDEGLARSQALTPAGSAA